jgi:predicted nucleotidyltransferase
VSKTIGIEHTLREGLKGIKRIGIGIIYGSVASGEDTGNSDVDVLLIGNPDMDDLVNTIQGIEKQVGRDINYVLYTPEEYGLKKKAENTFIMDVLRNPKIYIIGSEDGL